MIIIFPLVEHPSCTALLGRSARFIRRFLALLRLMLSMAFILSLVPPRLLFLSVGVENPGLFRPPSKIYFVWNTGKEIAESIIIASILERLNQDLPNASEHLLVKTLDLVRMYGYLEIGKFYTPKRIKPDT